MCLSLSLQFQLIKILAKFYIFYLALARLNLQRTDDPAKSHLTLAFLSLRRLHYIKYYHL